MSTTINAQTLKLLRPKIEAALAAVMAEAGLACKVTRGTYGGETGSFKLELCVPNESGETDPSLIRAERDFAQYANLFGLKASDLGAEIKINGKKAKIVGLMPNRPKFPIVARYEGAKDVVLFTQDGTVRALAASRAAV